MQSKIIGNITITGNANVLPHEMDTARALANAGYDVEFVRRTQGQRITSADFVADGVLWEVKAPSSGNIRVVQKHIRAALHQSRDIIFDSRRMNGLPDDKIQHEVEKWTTSLTYVRRMLYITHQGEVVKIK